MQGQERAFKATLRTAENAARGLREEMVRLKATLQQVRTQCANDVRKRDVQMQRLKSHLTTQQRGTRPPLTSSTISLTPASATSLPGLCRDEGGVPVDSPDYTLTQETTEFLTQLTQNLSDENDNLIGLVRSTLTTLRSLQGLSAPSTHARQQHPGMLADGLESSQDASGSTDAGTNLVRALSTSYDDLAMDMQDLLEHLRTLLTNPSFVPLEEVEVREEEIARLRDGWEKMDARWREAVHMMDGWRKRMARGGKAVNLDELRMGLSLSPVKVDKEADVIEEEADQELSGAGADELAVDTTDSHGTSLGETDEDDEDDVMGVGLRPDGSVLAEADHNARASVEASSQHDARSDQATSEAGRGVKIKSKIPRQVDGPLHRPRLAGQS